MSASGNTRRERVQGRRRECCVNGSVLEEWCQDVQRTRSPRWCSFLLHCCALVLCCLPLSCSSSACSHSFTNCSRAAQTASYVHGHPSKDGKYSGLCRGDGGQGPIWGPAVPHLSMGDSGGLCSPLMPCIPHAARPMWKAEFIERGQEPFLC